MTKLDEPILEDDFPVYAGYAYMVDGKMCFSPIQGTVRHLRGALKAAEVRRCDMIGRQILGKRDEGYREAIKGNR